MSRLNIWDFKKQGTLVGRYVGQFSGMGRFNSTIFHLKEKKSNKQVSIWGHYQIKLALSWLPLGTVVSIASLGVKKDGKKRVYDYRIKILERPEVPKTESMGRAGARRGGAKAARERKPRARSALPSGREKRLSSKSRSTHPAKHKHPLT
jgi:hypothetical protein